MVWYRHWLDMRFRAASALIFILVMTYSFSPSHARGNAFPMASMVARLGIGGARSWGAHDAETLALVLVLSVMTVGYGILSYGIGSGAVHRSAYYTLSLPVSRERLYSTRVLAGW